MEQTRVAPIRLGDAGPMNAHLSANELSGMVDGRLPDARRPVVEAHLAVCAECRAELISASAIVATAPPARAHPTRGNPWVARAMVAAAAVLAVLFVPRTIRHDAATPSTELTRRGSMAKAIAIVEPAAHVTLAGDSVRFTWHGERGASYRVVVTDSAGVTVFSMPTSDTVVVPPAGTKLVAGAHYLWYVEALLPDGSSPSTAPRSFSIRRK